MTVSQKINNVEKQPKVVRNKKIDCVFFAYNLMQLDTANGSKIKLDTAIDPK